MIAERTVRRRLLELVLVPTLLMSLLIGYSGFRDYQMLREGVMERGAAEARHLANLSEFGLLTSNAEQLASAAASLHGHGIVALRIYDADGQVRVHTGRGLSHPVVWPAGEGPCGEGDGLFNFCAPVRMTPFAVDHFSEFGNGGSESPLLGRVQIAISSADVEARRAAVLQAYALVLALVICLGVLMALRVERHLARPIAGLRDAVERVGRGELDVEVPADATGELLTLQRGFNAMAQSLASNHAEQERRIDEATALLRRALEELETRNQELNQEKHRAEAGSRAKSRFLAVMSHEIRTPLAGMIGMLTLLKKSGLDAEQANYVHNVEGAADTLRLLIDDILDYSRIEAGKLAVFIDPMRISKVVDEAVTMLAPSAADKGLEFIVHLAGDTPDSVIGDGLRVRQVLINLTANAIKFTERGFVRIDVRCTDCGADVARVRFTVEDSGIGIPADQQALVFESFTQVDSGPTRRYGGSGLGATISRELVHLMGGEIGLESTPGEGSRFWFELPLRVDPDAPVPAYPFIDQRVLVQERHPAARAALVEALEDLGATVFQTFEAAGGETLDYVFLCEDGVAETTAEAAANLRGRARFLCRVIPVSGSLKASGYDCHLNKPVTPLRLQQLAAQLAKSREALAAPLPMPEQLQILVAEDDDINARVIEVLLRRMGHVVTRARDGQEALDLLFHQRFDLAVLDIRMPGTDGPTVAQRWRTHERRAGGHLPLIALTANGSQEDREQCEAAGMDEFLVKPISEETLAGAVTRWGRPAAA